MKNISRIFSLLLSVVILAFIFTPAARAQSGSTTVYQLKPDGLAQLTSSPGYRTLGPTYAATMTLDPNAGIVHQILGVATTSATCTLNAPSGGTFGQILIILVQDTGGITLTFGTNFKSTGTVNPTTGKTIPVLFVSDGTNFREVARAAAE